jgi:hypothetical protein
MDLPRPFTIREASHRIHNPAGQVRQWTVTSSPGEMIRLAWRARSAAWMIRNRRALETAVVSAAA